MLASTQLIPKTASEWLQVAEDFENKWNFPNCLRCIDGKHVQIQAPNTSGFLYYNYKKTFSEVLLAVCDAHLKFSYIDVELSDGGILNQ